MSEPLVCAVLLTRDRPQMAARAVRCFRDQSYKRASIIALDTGDGDNLDIQGCHMPAWAGRSIGALRNEANSLAGTADILIHWDSDDYSYPNRIAEQVSLLQSSGADCIGYREMLFWREGTATGVIGSGKLYLDDALISERPVYGPMPGESWIFRHSSPAYCLGTSLCYWRSAWEKRPFPDLPSGEGPQRSGRGEDTQWLQGVRSVGVTSIEKATEVGNSIFFHEPRMIASIHAGNARYYEGLERSESWRRVPEWDEYCRERMGL